MNLKVAICCLCYLFCAFFVQQARPDTLARTVAWIKDVFQENEELIRRNAPILYTFIKDIATDIPINPDYAATIYFTGMVAVTYYYSNEAQQQLLKAKFMPAELKLISDADIIPILKQLQPEREFSKGDFVSFCRTKNEIGGLVRNALTSLRNFRKYIEQKMLDSTSGVEKNKVLQWLSAGGGVAGFAAIATAPCLTTGFLACPPVIAGSASLVSSIYGFFGFESNKLTLEETMSLLNVTRLEALEAEMVFRRALTEAEIMCAVNAPFPEKQLKSLDVYIGMSKKLKADRLQLEDGESQKNRPALTDEL